MKLQQLRYLLAIVENGLNITAAADRLFTSQPGVSKQLRLLEEELGVQIFTRKGKSLDGITDAGREIVKRAELIMREVGNIKILASNLRDDSSGSFSIATTHTQARYVLPPIIQEFRQRFPDVSFNVHQGTSEQIADLVAAGQVDFAIASGSGKGFAELVLLPCYEWDRILLAPRDHPLTKITGKITLQDLVHFPLVTYVFSSDGESSFESAFSREGLTPDVVFTARDADVIKTYVRMGMGVGVIASMAHEHEEADLVQMDARDLFPRCLTWIGFRRDAVLRDYMVEFLEMFAPHLTPDISTAAHQAPDQTHVDRLVQHLEVPFRSRYSEVSSPAGEQGRG